MSDLKISIVQFNPIIGDISGNQENIIKEIQQASKDGIDLIIFPELAICGYPPEDLLFDREFRKVVERALEEIAHLSKSIAIIIGAPIVNRGGGEKDLYNAAICMKDGRIDRIHHKWLLPTYDVFDERRYFEPGSFDTIFEVKGNKIGITVCEDLWQHAGFITRHYPRDPVLSLKQYSLDCVVNISASPYQMLKPLQRIEVCKKAQATLKCPIIMCCQVGAQGGLIFDGCSVVINRQNDLALLGGNYTEEHIQCTLNEIERKKIFYNKDRIEELFGALCSGIREYCYKNRVKKVCLGLSGGIDSSVVAVIAAAAVGAENVLGVSLPSEITSEESKRDAKQLAQNIQIDFEEIPINSCIRVLLTELSSHIDGGGRSLAEENIQSRIRGLSLMAIANARGFFLLSTGNKSELATGYCTLYGDMCGALSVLGDVKKCDVYALAHWINRSEEIIPKFVIEREPSAELRHNQKDTDSLPPYPVLDAIVEGYIEELLTEQEIVARYGIDQKTVREIICKIHAAEYKRRQAPIILNVSKKSLGEGRYYPIVERWKR